MTTARSQQIDLESTHYYHVISRCVRRAFLYGDDHFSGKNFDHRKQWIVDRMHFLASVFAIDICAFAIMSNHYHIVLHVDIEQQKSWSNTDVIERWGTLFPGSIAARCQSETLQPRELEAVNLQVCLWHQRLTDISWFMRCLNEWLAREANKEDQCTGRFWEGRYKSQALLDEGALLTCMAYVDLNPIRAGIAETPEDSDFTAIQARIKDHQVQNNTDNTLMPCYDADPDTNTLPITTEDYIALVDWTGRAIREDKQGSIPDDLRSILTRMNLSGEQWLPFVTGFEGKFSNFAGNFALPEHRPAQCQRVRGMGAAKQLYLAAA